MNQTYQVVRNLVDGQRVEVATFGDLIEASSLVTALSQYWPGGYEVIPLTQHPPDSRTIRIKFLRGSG